MKKIILTIAILVSLVLPVTAFTWDGYLDIGASFSGPVDSMEVEQTNKLALSMYAPFNTKLPMSLTAEGFYEFSFLKGLTSDDTIELSHLADITVLKYNIQFPLENDSYLSLDTGRFFVADSTGLILAQPLDGAKLFYNSDVIKASTYVGFTGLLNAKNISMNVTANSIETPVYSLAAPFVLFNTNMRMPQVFAEQDFYAELFATIDVGAETNKDHRIYTTMGLTGPITNDIIYGFSTTLSIAQTENEWNASNLSSFELTGFLPFASSLISWKTVFASEGSKTSFQPFTLANASMEDSVPYAGHIKTGLIASFRPINNLFLFAGSDVLFNVLHADTSKGYAGAQWAFYTRWEIISDVQFLASIEQFFPADASEKSHLKADLSISLEF